jgi:hypothetical protein
MPETETKTETEKADAAPDFLHVVPSTVTVSRSVSLNDSGEKAGGSEATEVIEIHKFVTPPAVARVLIPIKKVHNYNSAGLSVGVDLPCYKEELPEALEKAYNLAKDRLLAELPKIIKALKEI